MTATSRQRAAAPNGALALLVVAVVAFAVVFYLWPVSALLWRGRSQYFGAIAAFTGGT